MKYKYFFIAFQSQFVGNTILELDESAVAFELTHALKLIEEKHNAVSPVLINYKGLTEEQAKIMFPEHFFQLILKEEQFDGYKMRVKVQVEHAQFDVYFNTANKELIKSKLKKGKIIHWATPEHDEANAEIIKMALDGMD